MSKEAHTTLLVQMRDPADLPSIEAHLSRGQCLMLRGIDPLRIAGREQNNWGKNR